MPWRTLSQTPPPDEESKYNDGKGLLFTLEFTPLPAPLKPGEKRRKNKKLQKIKKTFYLHENTELNDLLRQIIKSLDAEDCLSFSWFPRNGSYSSTTIDIPGMTYSIAKTALKDISLSCEADYNILLDEADKKPNMITICMSEIREHDEGDEEHSSDEEETSRAKKKQKTHEPSAEEVEQNELIAELNAEWKCEDRACKRSPCYPDKITAKHVHLTHFHLQMWAAAIQGKVPDVNVQNPPPDKIFEHRDTDTDDLTLINNRSKHKTTTKDSNITINLTLPDAAAPRPHGPLPAPDVIPPAQRRRRIPPQMTLKDFCTRFHLTNNIQEKLHAYSVTGPQTLRHLADAMLVDAELNPAEIADVRDAQDRWMVGEGEN
ncbi:hypothetical protein DFH09DRAFT_1369087 [Mycena vulgaris]|nr:hypothetical protein DFH09DRAFT_1369087 [Mycena vulgaris]